MHATIYLHGRWRGEVESWCLHPTQLTSCSCFLSFFFYSLLGSFIPSVQFKQKWRAFQEAAVAWWNLFNVVLQMETLQCPLQCDWLWCSQHYIHQGSQQIDCVWSMQKFKQSLCAFARQMPRDTSERKDIPNSGQLGGSTSEEHKGLPQEGLKICWRCTHIRWNKLYARTREGSHQYVTMKATVAPILTTIWDSL